ncbi:flagellar hook protein FlgE [Sagittula salina]|uniref:Flagellar hook protein FlgE n=1 Tax=Sagittula salina TaxID=2820268 RepID=A0A940S2Z8_9RHOB|nr:flagellar hook-basal body complex protein [Sagittula salina]MBP0484581.1 flagellar hook-basal body complex protein [Sagittula salina]
MSISNAMASGVSGLLANSKAVENISYNIANADTVGYRRSFSQMVTSGSNMPTTSRSVGVGTTDAHANTADGSFSPTSVASNLAISGSGFFVVNSNIDASYTSGNVFTRVGSFEPDANGNLRNAAGLYLMGFPSGEDGTLGAVDRSTFDDLQPVNVANRTLGATPTTTMSLSGNLPSQETGQMNPGEPFVTSAVFYNALGEAQQLSMSFQPTWNKNEWDITISHEGMDYGRVTVRFSDTGTNVGSPDYYGDVQDLSWNNGFSFNTATGTMTLDLYSGGSPQTLEVSLGAISSSGGLTQFSGDYTPLNVEADGSASGTMSRVEFDEFGTVWGVFDNGSRSALYSIPLATFANPNGLATSNNSTFTTSRESGSFYLGNAGTGETGTLSSGGVETANVDIAEELTSLIQKQRAYSSNAKIITTADEMLNETVNLKR